MLLREVAAHAARHLPGEVEMLAGLELGGVPVATALGLATGLPVAFVRNTARSYGARQLAEGAPIERPRVLVVEDVVTSGGQVVHSTAQLRELGAIVDNVLCVVDRGEGGAEDLAEIGLTMTALFTADELRSAAA